MRLLDIAVASCVAGISLGITVPRAFGYPLWQDEVGTARAVVARSFSQLVATVTARENHPPGYYALVWFVHRSGVPVVDLRVLSVAAAATVVLAVVLYARRLVPLYLAGVAGLLVCLSWQLEAHGWELRPYALLALVSFAAVLAVERAAARPTPARLVQVVLVVSLGGVVHDYFVFTVAACVVWLFGSSAGRGRAGVLAAVASGMLPLALWAPRFLDQYRHRHFQTLPGFTVGGVMRLYADLFARSVPRGVLGGLSVAALFLLVITGGLALWRDPGRGRLCALAAVLPVAAAAGLWLAGPHVFAARALIGVLPFAAICCVAPLAALPRPTALIAAAAMVAVIAFGFSRSDGRIVPHYDRVAAALVASGWRPEQPIILFGPLYAYLDPLDWYLPGGARLAPALASTVPCTRASVVAVGAEARRLVRDGGGHGIRTVGGVVIAVERWRTTTWRDVRERGGTVIGTRKSSCLAVRWGR